MMNSFLNQAQSNREQLIAWRRDFHQHPELAFAEHRSAKIIAETLEEMGLSVQTAIAETGVVGTLKGGRLGPTLLIRFDMDALPIVEETGAAYASRQEGVMHACGHDGHMAIGLGVAQILNSKSQELPGTIVFIFQPAEEGQGGAERMIAEGILDDLGASRSLGLHIWNEKPLHWLGIAPGPVMAGSERFDIMIHGRGGHGASPHLARDPILAASQLVTACQSITSRSLDPLESGVVSFTVVQAGETWNVIPSSVRLEGTIRTFSEASRLIIIERMKEISIGICSAAGCQVELEFERITPQLVNDADTTALAAEVAQQLFPEFEIDHEHRVMGSEDMAFFMQEVPGCYLFIGSSNSARNLDAPHHNPLFDFDEKVLPIAAGLVAAVAWRLQEKES
ncbi:MAG: amidohydrolase [Anaerolineales bacterium]|nr:MAG: amidohydrolase [Anaerolineales bacterium]